MTTVAISGAGSGLGRALALKYSTNGCKVFLLGRNDTNLHLVRTEIIRQGGHAEVILCDVQEPASVSIAFQQIGELDILINNAGIGLFGPVENYTINDIDKTLKTNVKGTILCVQSALPLIRASQGRILSIISTAGLTGKNHESIYSASEFAIKGFTESLQNEWKNDPIAITAVYVGGMNTPFWNNSSHVDDPSRLKDPNVVARQIFNEDNGRKDITIDS
ncbi:SDR family NAD(P)-dependent oxidoreductase [Lentibacillus halophilus]|uniref:SDR family NAD(P)-dependent oxidoreductase n=1 Tax=Lentibacillus halophilus TaxID=295065 RepID=A0ABP3J448_9BACI